MQLRSLLIPLGAAALLLGLSGCGALDGAGGAAAGPVTNSSELGPEDGYIPDGGSVALTDDVPAVTGLDDRLRDALHRAEKAASSERDVEFTLANGWRSERYQRFLFDRAVKNYGSEEEASRWVKKGNESKHVVGKAVDIATADAMDWLSRFGGKYGLCQVYANEAWHFELTANSQGVCPAQLVDSTAG